MARRGHAPRVLFLAHRFPPARTSGVYRPRAMANHLAARGWDVTVFTAPTRFLREVIGSWDEALAETVDPRVRVRRPGMRYFPWESDVRRFSRFRANFPFLAREMHSWGLRRVFPDSYSSWGPSSVALGLRLHLRRRFDLILATGNPWVSFAAAWALNRLTGVPYVLDYRDAWTLDEFRDEPAFPDGHIAWRWERRVLSRASAVTFVNEGQREWHARRYPEVAPRLSVLLNGFDAELLDPAEPPATESPDTEPCDRAGSRPLRLAYVGTITRPQPIEQLAEAFQLAGRDPAMTGAQLNLYGHLGFFRGSGRSIEARLNQNAGASMQYRGPLAKAEVSRVYRESDVLVFMAAGSRYVTSGKIFEYMAAGLPIVSVHEADIAARDVLRGYPLWFDPGGLDVPAIAKAMTEAAHTARTLTASRRRAARQYAATFERSRLLDPFEQRLREIVARDGKDRAR